MLNRLSKDVYRRACRFFDRASNCLVPNDVCQIRLLDLNELNEPTISPEYSFRFIETEELPLHVSNPQADIEEAMSRVLAEPNIRCFRAFGGDVLLGYGWVATGDVAPEHNTAGHPFTGVGLSLPSEVAYLFKCFVLPEYRGRGINKQLLWRLSGVLKRDGKAKLITTTDWLNFAFQSSSGRLGFKKVGLSTECKIFGKRFYRWTDLRAYGVELYRPEPQHDAQ